MRAKDHTGLIGEEKAADFLQEAGHRILDRRWRCKTGELDLVTLHDGELVAVEVKTRRGLGYGHPLEAVTAQKLQRLQRLITEYASAHNMWALPRRVDAVSVLLSSPQHSGDEEVLELDYLKDLRG